MARKTSVWVLVRRQHGAVTRKQLLDLGFSGEAIDWRLERGRLHKTPWRGVYAVGRPNLTRLGFLMAAVLASGEGAALSHHAAAEFHGIRRQRTGEIDVNVPKQRRRQRGIRPHHRPGVCTTKRDGIPVTTIVETLIDIRATERDVIEADKRDVIHLGPLRRALEAIEPRPGVRRLVNLIDRHTFTFTDSELEDAFLPIARRAGYPKPLTQVWVNRRRVDFYFESLGVVVETDGGRYHRTAIQQTEDIRRDFVHRRAGLLPLRFTHGLIRYEPEEVEEMLRWAREERLSAAGSSPAAAA